MMVLGAKSDQAGFPPNDLSGLPAVNEFRKRDKVRVLVNSYTPGLATRDTKDGPIYGFEVDLAKSLAGAIFGNTADVDSHIEFVEVDNALKLDMLIEHQVDFIIANLFDTPERRKRIGFAGHYISARNTPVEGPGCPEIRKQSDLAGLRVAVEAGTSDEDTLLRVAPDAEVVAMDPTTDWVALLNEGNVQAFWADTIWSSQLPGQLESNVRTSSFHAGVGHAAIGINQDDDSLRRFINDFIAHTLTTGQLQQSLRRWGL